MKKLMTLIALSCKKATLLVEKKSLFPLSVIENLQLIVHTSMCKACTGYKNQSELIDEALLRHLEQSSGHVSTPVSGLEEFKQDTISKL